MAADMVEPADHLFAHWRRTGDAKALAEVYDRTAPQLLRVALHLVRHPAHAEDLLQATFVAAIEGAASYDPARPLLGWLGGILHNQAKWLLRREGREPDPLRLPAARAADPLEQAAAAEFTAQIDDAIARLPAAYQPVLRLHLRLQLSAVDIAHALDRPAGTVRSQIVRGLELLRQRLGAGVALAAVATLGTRGLAAVRAAVLAHGSQVAAAAAAGAAAASIPSAGWFGGILVMKKVMVAVAALLLVALAFWMQRPAALPARPAAAAAEPANAAGTNTHAAADAPLARTAVSPQATPADGGWWLEGHVRGPDGALAGAEVRVSIAMAPHGGGTTCTDAAGHFAFALETLRALPPIDLDRAELTLAAWAPAHAEGRASIELPHREVARPLHLVQDLELSAGRTLAGRVVTGDGTPVGGTEITVDGGRGRPNRQLSASTLADGTYRLPLTTDAALTVRAAHALHGTAAVSVAPGAAGDAVAPDLVLQPMPVVAARLVFDDGSPAAGLRVQLVVPIEPGVQQVAAATTTDADGRLAVRSLPLGRYQLRIESFSRCPDWPELGADVPEPTIALRGMHHVRLSFCDQQGRKLQPLWVAWTEFDATQDAELRAARAGRVALDDLPNGPRGTGGARDGLLAEGHWLWIRASHRTASGEALLQAVTPGYVHDVELRLVEHPRTATLRIAVRRAGDGAVLPVRARLSQRFLHEPALADEPESTPEGLLLRANPGRFEVRIEPRWRGDDLGEFAAFTREVELRDGGTTEISETIQPGGRVRLCVHLPTPRSGPIDGFAVASPSLPEAGGSTSFIKTLSKGWTTSVEVLPDQPVQWQPLLPPGHHELRIRSRDYQDLVLGVVVRAGEVTDVDVYLQAR